MSDVPPDRPARGGAGRLPGRQDTEADLPERVAGREQALSDSEQTLSDADQTAQDGDQTGADTDQDIAESDQQASDEDQAASDRDLATGTDRAVHDASRLAREQNTLQRRRGMQGRLRTAHERDTRAQVRDRQALVRDRAAAERDRSSAVRESGMGGEDSATTADPKVVSRTAQQLSWAAALRVQAAENRAIAAADRAAAARDRERAAEDRENARVDREALTAELTKLERDPLTGARMRGAGLHDLDLELSRCGRTDTPITVAYIDVVGLKAVNDFEGHDAGDRLLRRAVTTIRAHLRPYDLIIRLGGDEFLCAVPAASLTELQHRFDAIATALNEGTPGCALRLGFAEWMSGESAGQLITRADHELLSSRPTNERRSTRRPPWERPG